MSLSGTRPPFFRWLAERFQPSELILWLPIAIVFAAGAAISIHINQTLRADRNLVVHSHRVIEAGQRLLIGLADAETGQRGYLITGERRYLEPHDAGQRKAAAAIAELDTLVSDNALQRDRVARLRALSADKNEEMAHTLAARDQAGQDAARALVAADRGKNIMDSLRGLLDELNDAEARILASREAEVQRDEFWVVLAGVAIAAASLATRLAIALLRRRRVRTGKTP